MTVLFAVLAVVSGSASAWLCYLASPQQQWRATGRLRFGVWLGAVLALLSLLMTMQTVAPMEAVFAWSVLWMFVASLAPFLGAWRARVRARKVAV